MVLRWKEGYIMSEIVISNLIKDIKRVRILDSINLVLSGGHIYGLRGKNGSGKTMLMRAICGLIIPTEGTIKIDGKELHKDIDFPPSIGALIENPAFLPSYSGYTNLKMLATLAEQINENDILNALRCVGLEETDNRAFRKYSLGMKQKLGIAYAIMGEPDIIILDEPINALDEESVVRIKRELIRLKEKGKLIIVACHDKEELEYLSDTIFDMKKGRIISEVR